MKQNFKQDALYHELTLTHGGAMMRLARLSEANSGKRDDLVQIMNVELWKSLSRFDNRCSQKTWVYRVIHNVAASYVRKETRRNGPFVALDNLDELAAEGDTHDDVEQRDGRCRGHAIGSGGPVASPYRRAA